MWINASCILIIQQNQLLCKWKIEKKFLDCSKWLINEINNDKDINFINLCKCIQK